MTPAVGFGWLFKGIELRWNKALFTQQLACLTFGVGFDGAFAVSSGFIDGKVLVAAHDSSRGLFDLQSNLLGL